MLQFQNDMDCVILLHIFVFCLVCCKYICMFDQILQNSTKQFYTFNKKTILIQRIVYIFNEIIILIQQSIYVFNKVTSLIQRIIYIFKEIIIFNELCMYSTN